MSLRIYGATSGYVDLDAPAVAGSASVTLPGSGTLALFSQLKVLQVVFSSDSTSTSSTSTSYVDTGLSASITPSSVTSKVLVLANVNGTQKNASTARMNLKLLRNATDLINFWIDGFDNGSNNINVGSQSASYLDNPNTTSAVTYKTQMAIATGTSGIIYADSGPCVSTMILMEIAA